MCIMAGQPVPHHRTPCRNKDLFRPYWGKPMVNMHLIRPYFWASSLNQSLVVHKIGWYIPQLEVYAVCLKETWKKNSMAPVSRNPKGNSYSNPGVSGVIWISGMVHVFFPTIGGWPVSQFYKGSTVTFPLGRHSITILLSWLLSVAKGPTIYQ